MYSKINFVTIFMWAFALTSWIKPVNSAQIEFIPHIITEDFNGATSVYPVDLDGDGDMDLLGTSYIDDEIAWWENDGECEFSEHMIAEDFTGVTSVYAVDLDSDGDLDILGAAYDKDHITWWENDGEQEFTEHTISDDFMGASSVYPADLDGDGDLDVLGTASIADDIVWFENDGEQDFSEHVLRDNYEGARGVYAFDLDDDGDMDVVAGSRSEPCLFWWENDGEGEFNSHTITEDDLRPEYFHAVDVNSDGNLDLLVASNRGSGIFWVEYNDEDGSFEHHQISGANNLSIYASDMDGDGDVDVLGTAWYENIGEQEFHPQYIGPNIMRSIPANYADIDRDGDLDVVGVGSRFGVISWWESEITPLGWNTPPEIHINEDIPTQINFESIYEYIFSPGTPDSMLTLSVGDGRFVSGEITEEGLTITSDEDWHGRDSLMLIVSDPDENTDTTYQQIIVHPMNDLPYTFSLSRPANGSNFVAWRSEFRWERAHQKPWELDHVRYTLDLYWSEGELESSHTIDNIPTQRYPGVDMERITDWLELDLGEQDYNIEWWVTAVDDSGSVECNERFNFVIPMLGVDQGGDGFIPQEFSLLSSYPNPFNSSITITYGLPKASQISIGLFDLSGHRVVLLVNGQLQAGVHKVILSADELVTGMYIIHAKTSEWAQSRKVMLIR